MFMSTSIQMKTSENSVRYSSIPWDACFTSEKNTILCTTIIFDMLWILVLSSKGKQKMRERQNINSEISTADPVPIFWTTLKISICKGSLQNKKRGYLMTLIKTTFTPTLPSLFVTSSIMTNGWRQRYPPSLRN